MHDKTLVREKLLRWESVLQQYELPSWDMLPGIDLYMDQVLVLLTQYLNFLPKEDDAGNVTTAAMINNYVKQKVVPAPIKKRYNRTHLAFLIILCTLKQTFGIASVQHMLPVDAPEEAVRSTYDAFVRLHKDVSAEFLAQVRSAAAPALLSEEADERAVNGLILRSAISASLFRLLGEKLITLTAPDEPPLKTK